MLQQKIIEQVAKDTFIDYKHSSHQNLAKWFESLEIKDHDEAFELLKKTLIQKQLYENINLYSTLQLGDITNKLIEKYSKEIIIEAMVEDSILNSISLNKDNKSEFGFALSALIDEL